MAAVAAVEIMEEPELAVVVVLVLLAPEERQLWTRPALLAQMAG
jgi:hypothetical protein